MSFSLNNAPIEIPCPACGRRVKTTVGATRRNGKVRCPGGHVISPDGAEFGRELKKFEDAVNDLRRGR